MTDTPDPVDRKVGALIRLRRRALGMSQTVLAEACGVTFQQLQKYERAANRVSASMLVKIAGKLGTSPGFFFGDLGSASNDGDEAEGPLIRFSNAPNSQRVIEVYPRLEPVQRAAVLSVLDAFGAEAGAQ